MGRRITFILISVLVLLVVLFGIILYGVQKQDERVAQEALQDRELLRQQILEMLSVSSGEVDILTDEEKQQLIEGLSESTLEDSNNLSGTKRQKMLQFLAAPSPGK